MTEAHKTGSHNAVIKRANDLRNSLVGEWNKGLDRSQKRLDDLLEEAKIHLTKMESYMTLKKERNAEDLKEMELARELLELGARASVAKMASEKSDESLEFDRYIAQLKHYYFDMNVPSPYKFEILGMNLLKLLSQNRIREFHVELELFVNMKPDEVLNNEYIKKVVEIEQFMNEGRYNKILAQLEEVKKQGIKSSGFRYFIERVVENSREVIADVFETAYDRIEVNFALKSLHMAKQQESFAVLAKERSWHVGADNFVYFPKPEADGTKVPAIELMEKALTYAKEMDTIV